MGKGHFAGLGCNGYFAAGHWGGDGTPVASALSVGGVSYWLKPRRLTLKENKGLLERLLEYLQVKVKS